ncbi:MAG: hypothetical protein ACK559_04575, partial [bacterium]
VVVAEHPQQPLVAEGLAVPLQEPPAFRDGSLVVGVEVGEAADPVVRHVTERHGEHPLRLRDGRQVGVHGGQVAPVVVEVRVAAEVDGDGPADVEADDLAVLRWLRGGAALEGGGAALDKRVERLLARVVAHG